MEEVPMFFLQISKMNPKTQWEMKMTDKSAKIITQPDDVKQEPGKVTGTKVPYNCNKCGKEFKAKANVKRYMERVHFKVKVSIQNFRQFDFNFFIYIVNFMVCKSSYFIPISTMALREGVKKRIFYGQADRKRFPPPLPRPLKSDFC